MAQKRVMISIDEQLNERWNDVAKMHGITKSSMIEEFLINVLPVLANKTPSRIMASALSELSRGLNETASLFEDMEHDRSVEDYKSKKRG